MGLRCILAVCGISLFSSIATAQTTITVGQGGGYDHGTIQTGIDAATTGDTVLVYPGTYFENIHFRGKNIILRSTEPTSPAVVAATIIDGSTSGTVVRFAGTENEDCVLSGFTIQNGDARPQGLYENGGGGIQGGDPESSHSLARIEYNVITHNRSREDGGGMVYCDGLIQYNEISHNSPGDALGSWGYYGGGVLYCDGTIQYNRIYWNHGGVRGSMFWGSTGHALIQCEGSILHNWIYNNEGALSGCDGLIEGNLVVGNSSRFGAGISWAKGTIRNNTVLGNYAGDEGCGLYGCSGQIENCIVWGNSTRASGYYSSDQVLNCTTPTYSCIEDWAGGGEGNITADPLFAPSGMYPLLPESPCVDAGNPAPEFNDAFRPPGQGGERNDMGAYGGRNNRPGWPFVAADLRVHLIKLMPRRLIRGQPFTIFGTITNASNTDVTEPFWVGFKRKVTTSLEYHYGICDSILIDRLGAGETIDLSTITPQRTVYGGISTGWYSILATVDEGENIVEWNEENNTSEWGTINILPDRPNLCVEEFRFQPEEIGPNGGERINFSGRVFNDSYRATAEAFWVEFRLWPDDDFQPNGPYLCNSLLVTSSLAQNDGISLSSAVFTTIAIPEGEYTVGVVVDPTNTISEQDEKNNILWVTDRKLRVRARATGAESWIAYP